MKWKALMLALTLYPLVSGCGLIVRVCEINLIPGIEVRMTDSISGQPVVVDAIFATATMPAYADTVTQVGGSSRFTLIEDRAGVYTVQISVPGYAVWQRKGVEVLMENECHVMTRSLPVLLQALR